MRNVVVPVSSLEDMVKLYNDGAAVVANNLKWLKRANSKTKFVAIIALGGAAYAVRAAGKLAAKVDRLEENYRSLYRNYIRDEVDSAFGEKCQNYGDDLG